MAQDIKFIRLDDDISDYLNRQADEHHCRVSELANELIRRQIWGAGAAPATKQTD
jgi:hypothetical protein